MWTHPLTIALVAAGSSLVTILLTPWLQHYLWRYQRRAEIRLEIIKEFNRLTSDFLTDYNAAPRTYKPSADWFKAFLALTGNIKALFSAGAFNAFKAVEVMIGPGTPGLGAQGNRAANDFVEARDTALRALYCEVVAVEDPVKAPR